MTDETAQDLAIELAPELDALITAYLNTGILGTAEYYRLERFLWDNKIGILRIMQQFAQSE